MVVIELANLKRFFGLIKGSTLAEDGPTVNACIIRSIYAHI